MVFILFVCIREHVENRFLKIILSVVDIFKSPPLNPHRCHLHVVITICCKFVELHVPNCFILKYIIDIENNISTGIREFQTL